MYGIQFVKVHETAPGKSIDENIFPFCFSVKPNYETILRARDQHDNLIYTSIPTISQPRKPFAFKNDPEFSEKYFSQTLDHFNFNNMGNMTFSQRYLITGKDSFPL